jgi:hypothetical protein
MTIAVASTIMSMGMAKVEISGTVGDGVGVAEVVGLVVGAAVGVDV